ncbi:C40 family peptidase [Nocardioides pakistanensis]
MTDCGTAEVREVAVPVTTLWTAPEAPREIDRPAVLDVPDMTAWTASMDATVRKGLTGRTLTQALLGEPVHVLGRVGDWVRVAALWQPSSAHPSGYPGWVRRSHLAPAVPGGAAHRAVVVSPTAELVLDGGARFRVSFGTSLAVADAATVLGDDGRGRGQGARAVEVLLPGSGGPVGGRLAAADVRLVAGGQAPPPTAESLLATAEMFLGLRYLWGGTSAWGLDCSGLVHLVLRTHGVTVPRDAFDQADRLVPVDLDAVEPGDLYFFARPGERVYHVGFVSAPVAADGVRRMLHAPEGGELVEDAPLAPHRVETLVSAARIQERVRQG